MRSLKCLNKIHSKRTERKVKPSPIVLPGELSCAKHVRQPVLCKPAARLIFMRAWRARSISKCCSRETHLSSFRRQSMFLFTSHADYDSERVSYSLAVCTNACISQTSSLLRIVDIKCCYSLNISVPVKPDKWERLLLMPISTKLLPSLSFIFVQSAPVSSVQPCPLLISALPSTLTWFATARCWLYALRQLAT